MVFFFTWFLYTQVVITNLDIDDKLMIISSQIQSKARYQILHPFYQLKCFFSSYINQRVNLQHEFFFSYMKLNIYYFGEPYPLSKYVIL